MDKKPSLIKDGYNTSYIEITKEEFINFQKNQEIEPQQQMITVNHLRLTEDESQD